VILEPSGIREAVDQYLTQVHEGNADRLIRAADGNGAFPDAIFGELFRQASFAVVADTNLLLQDIADSCKRSRRLALVTATNTGAVRLFCAEHVVREVEAHALAFSADVGVNARDFVTRWRAEYVPLLRVVPDDAIPAALFTEAERLRVQRLNASKDVPSVRLAIALGALFLTKDQAPRAAVYDTRVSAGYLENWLSSIRGGNTADELAKFGYSALLIPALMLEGGFHFISALASNAPWALLPLLGGLAYGATRIPREHYGKVGSVLTYGAEIYAAFRERYVVAMEAFRQREPDPPPWSQLAQELSRRAVLLRACLFSLARSPRSHLSAVELARRVPELGVAQSAARVREVLRSSACCHEPYRGRWQLGKPAMR
jgi:predicted nucleic acid-binding protein